MSIKHAEVGCITKGDGRFSDDGSLISMNQTTESSATARCLAPEGHLNKSELARLLRRGVRTIEEWMRRGQVPYYKTGRRVSFIYSEVESALRVNFRVAGQTQPQRNTSPAH